MTDKIRLCLRSIPAVFLLAFNWWTLKNKAVSAGSKSIWATAYALKMRVNHSFIGAYSQISSKPKLGHGLCGIYISEFAVIGDNCTIYQHVTIGNNVKGKKSGGSQNW